MLNTRKESPSEKTNTSDLYGCYWVRIVNKNTLEKFQKS